MTPPSIDRSATVVKTGAELRGLLDLIRKNGGTVGLVPTMGALHEGHRSLVERAASACDHTVASIFVNPTQFAAGEDLDKYPRPLEADLALLDAAGADTIFCPEVDEMYPPGFSTLVQAPAIGRRWEGESRPTHFQGVATVVLKLFQLVQPQIAFFGQKDFQQSLVVQHMVRDLNIPVEIVVCPTVREPDGLAMSSRNRYLTHDQREKALAIFRTLCWARDEIKRGRHDGAELMRTMHDRLTKGGFDSVDYAALCDPGTLEPLDTVRLPLVALVAGRIGKTRLIDNLCIE